MEILVISNHAPYDGVPHAGEKTHNYYLKEFAKESVWGVRLISFCSPEDFRKLDLAEYRIEATVFQDDMRTISQVKRKINRVIGYTLNSKDKYANFSTKDQRKKIIDTLNQFKEEGYYPDCIVLEWTHIILLVELVKEIYPNSKIIASSHDVNHIGSERIYNFERNRIKKLFRKRQFLNLKKREVAALEKCDLIVTQNINDIDIFKSFPELQHKNYLRIAPYYDDYSDVKRKPQSNQVIFFGAMGRPENYLSVQWFIENVFWKLSNFDFVIIGGGATQEIKKYESDRIHITGFLPIEQVKSYFSSCTCMVVPLILGSGIKVKVLEAFSAGIPVITNNIGIEGILAEDRKSYIHCDTIDDYIAFFDNISNIDLNRIGENAKEFVLKEHSLVHSREKYINSIKLLCTE